MARRRKKVRARKNSDYEFSANFAEWKDLFAQAGYFVVKDILTTIAMDARRRMPVKTTTKRHWVKWKINLDRQTKAVRSSYIWTKQACECGTGIYGPKRRPITARNWETVKTIVRKGNSLGVKEKIKYTVRTRDALRRPTLKFKGSDGRWIQKRSVRGRPATPHLGPAIDAHIPMFYDKYSREVDRMASQQGLN